MNQVPFFGDWGPTGIVLAPMLGNMDDAIQYIGM